MTASQWTISDPKKEHAEAIERFGEEEWARRLEIVEDKTEELRNLSKSSWREAVFYGPQFEVLARLLDQDKWDRFKEFPVRRWTALVDKLVLG